MGNALASVGGVAAAAFAAAIGAGVGGALLDGTWSIVLISGAALALLAAAALFFKDLLWQSGEQDNNKFRRKRSEDSRDRKVAAYARAVKRELHTASHRPSDEHAARTSEAALLERMRRFISDARRVGIDMLVLREHPGDSAATVVYHSGSHDSALLEDAAALQQWLDTRDESLFHRTTLPGCDNSLSLLATSDEELDHFDRAEIERSANNMGMMITLHRLRRDSAGGQAAADG